MRRWSSTFNILASACKSSIPVFLTQPVATRRPLFCMTWSLFLDDALVLGNHIGAAYVNREPMSDL